MQERNVEYIAAVCVGQKYEVYDIGGMAGKENKSTKKGGCGGQGGMPVSGEGVEVGELGCRLARETWMFQ